MTIEKLERAIRVRDELELARSRCKDLVTLKDYIDAQKSESEEYILMAPPIHRPDIKALFDKLHFQKFLDVEIMRAESEVERLQKELANL